VDLFWNGSKELGYSFPPLDNLLWLDRAPAKQKMCTAFQRNALGPACIHLAENGCHNYNQS
jgi:hypothetical protein